MIPGFDGKKLQEMMDWKGYDSLSLAGQFLSRGHMVQVWQINKWRTCAGDPSINNVFVLADIFGVEVWAFQGNRKENQRQRDHG